MDDSRERLISCFATVFPDLGREEIPLASMASVGSWGSLATITLVTVIEEQFAVQVPSEDLGEFVSFELILDYLKHQHCHVC